VLNEEDVKQLRARCTRWINGHGIEPAGALLATIPPDVELDRYGDGGVVAELEREICTVLGKPAAVFLPSGTMAQQIVLRVLAGRTGRRTVVYHPMCHLEQHEDGALTRLQGLVGRPVGDRHRLLGVEDLARVAEPVAALLVELPQRDLGGAQPSWDELSAQISWARVREAGVHLDGARLWESAAGYDRTPAQVAEQFDTVYVSFYKGIGALPGCCVAGPDDVVAEVREWRKRMGGTLFGMWPNAASALTLLRRRLPLFPAYLERAREIADAVRDLDGVRVVPDPPQTPMLHLLLATTPERYADAVRRVVDERGIWPWHQPMATGDPGVLRVELSVGDATCALDVAEVRDVLATLVS
jgi:threonine aldolase